MGRPKIEIEEKNPDLICPKCSSPDVEVFKDRSQGWSKMSDLENIFHCHSCGKILYGKDANGAIQKQLEEKKVIKMPSSRRTPQEGESQDQFFKRLSAISRAEKLRKILKEVEDYLPTVRQYRDHLESLSPGVRDENFKGALNLIKIEVNCLLDIQETILGASPNLEKIQARWAEIKPSRTEDRYRRALALVSSG